MIRHKWMVSFSTAALVSILASPALGDLVQFPPDVLWERGRRPYQAHGRLLLNDWAAECAGISICSFSASGTRHAS